MAAQNRNHSFKQLFYMTQYGQLLSFKSAHVQVKADIQRVSLEARSRVR